MVVSNAVASSASLVTVARRQPQGWPNGCGQNSSPTAVQMINHARAFALDWG